MQQINYTEQNPKKSEDNIMVIELSGSMTKGPELVNLNFQRN